MNKSSSSTNSTTNTSNGHVTNSIASVPAIDDDIPDEDMLHALEILNSKTNGTSNTPSKSSAKTPAAHKSSSRDNKKNSAVPVVFLVKVCMI